MSVSYLRMIYLTFEVGKKIKRFVTSPIQKNHELEEINQNMK